MPGILSFCKDALECLSLHHDQGANVFLRHLAYGIVYGVSRAYRKNLVAFFTEQLPDRCHRRLPCGRLAVMRVDPIGTHSYARCAFVYTFARQWLEDEQSIRTAQDLAVARSEMTLNASFRIAASDRILNTCIF